jgi:methylglutamate dehydrogenase subunit C
MNDAAPHAHSAMPARRLGDNAPLRLADGGLIDRSRTLAFTFDGQRYLGHPGDTLASALIANGVRLVGRSFKYHRPRGILSAGPEEPNALVELRSGPRREPNTRATTIELYDGLVAASQNRWPSLKYDLLSVNSLAGPIIGAGFYYKTFMWPAAWWEKVYEPLIRRAAGLGRASGVPDPDTYDKATLHCDVLVVGAGPAGLMAALTAGRSGARP